MPIKRAGMREAYAGASSCLKASMGRPWPPLCAPHHDRRNAYTWGVHRLAVVTLLLACDRGPAPAPAPTSPTIPSAATAPAAAATPPGCKLSPLPLRIPATKRVVAIGDLHGDLVAMLGAFRAAGAIDAQHHWAARDLTIVQTGDILDRGTDENAMLELLAAWEKEAPEFGSRLVLLDGNHELMNASGDFRYVFEGQDLGSDRKAKVAPGGSVAKAFAAHGVVAIVGDTVYSHAGVLPSWAAKLDDANLAVRCWLDGSGPTEALQAEDSPVWTRAYGVDPPDCDGAKAALIALGAKRMVVAHTVQAQGINAACDGALWRIDVGMTKVFKGPIQVLEVSDLPRVITGSR